MKPQRALGMSLIALSFSLIAWAIESNRIPNNYELEFSKPPIFSFSAVDGLIKSQDIKSVEQLLGSMPKDYLKHLTFLYKSHSLQPASPDYPRVIAYGGDARFLMTFAGNPSQPEHHTIETAEYEGVEKGWHFRRIIFDPAAQKQPQVQDSPAICTSCHGAKPKPIWDAYPFWRGAYGSRSANKMDRITRGSLEDQFYQSFLANQRDQGIYAYFPKYDGSDLRLEREVKRNGHAITFTPNGAISDPTAFLSEQLGEIVLRGAAHEIKSHPLYARFKWVLAFTALCERSVAREVTSIKVENGQSVVVSQRNQDHLPPETYLSAKEAQALPSYWKTYLNRVNEDHARRLKEATFYNATSKALEADGDPMDEADFKNFAASRYEYKSTWVYVLGLMGMDPRNWAMSFDHGPLNLEEGGPPAYLRLGYLVFHDDPEVQKYLLVETMRTFRQATPEACVTLAKMSRDAMEKLVASGDLKSPDRLLEPVKPPTANLPLPAGVPSVVNKCLACHSFEGGAPPIPLDQPAQLALMLKKPLDEGKPPLIDDILDRVASGDMPRRSILSDAEKTELESFIRGLGRR